MKRGVHVLAALLSLIGLMACERSTAPGVLLITIDTLRADHLGSYGSQSTRTPNIDQFASSGTLFEHAAAPMPLTRPSHFSIFTSLYPREHGVLNNAIQLPDSVETLTEILRDQGYRTGGFVGVSLLDEQSGAAQGFEVYEAPSEPRQREASQVAGRAIDWISNLDSDEPFFAWVHFFDPHLPYAPPQAFLPEPKDGLASVSAESLERVAMANDGDVPEAVFERAKALYRGEVEYVDHWVGELFAALAGLGRYDTTLSVLTADHGESFERGVFFEHADSLYQEAIRIPLIFRYPSVFSAGSRVLQQVGAIDVAPTVLAALGLSVPEGFGGLPLHEIEAGGERYVLIQHPFYQPKAAVARPKRQAAIRSVAGMPTKKILLDAERIGVVGETWKYVLTEHREEIFRLSPIQDEDDNLAGRGVAPEQQLREVLRGEREAHPLQLINPVEISTELLETLKALGYVD